MPCKTQQSPCSFAFFHESAHIIPKHQACNEKYNNPLNHSDGADHGAHVAKSMLGIRKWFVSVPWLIQEYIAPQQVG
jgi:hypothetical protein